MGLCMDPKYASRSVLEDACDKFKPTAKKCFYGISTYFKAFPAAAEGRVDVTNTMDQFIQFSYCCVHPKQYFSHQALIILDRMGLTCKAQGLVKCCRKKPRSVKKVCICRFALPRKP